MGIGTRSGLKKAIRAGAIFVNGVPVKKADTAGRCWIFFPLEHGAILRRSGVSTRTRRDCFC